MRGEMLERLQLFSGLVSEAGLLELLEMIWSTEKQATIPSAHSTARHVSAKLRDWQIRAKTFELPADGETVLGGFKVPVSWDCRSAILEIIDPFELRHKNLADWKKTSASVMYGTVSTPQGGVTAAVVKISSLDEIQQKQRQIPGKIVFSSLNPHAFENKLAEAGAAALISSWNPVAHYLPDSTAYVTGKEKSPPLPTMMIDPNTAVELDVLLERGPVRLRIAIVSERAKSTMPVLCGYIDGPMQEEVLAIGPLLTPSASSAAASAAILEVMRVLQENSAAGKIPPMRRAVRALFGARDLGVAGFCALNPGILRRILAAVSFDGIGRHQEAADAELRRILCPHAAPSIADTLFSILLDEWLPRALPYANLRTTEFTLHNNGTNDPRIAIPTPAVIGGDRFSGTSADNTRQTISARSMHAFATITAAYLHTLATCTAKEALWLAEETIRVYGTKMEGVASQYSTQLQSLQAAEEKSTLLAKAGAHLDYLKEVAEQAAMSAKNFMLREERAQGHFSVLKIVRHLRRLVDVEKRRLKEIAGVEAGSWTLHVPDEAAAIASMRPYRLFSGSPRYDAIARESRGTICDPEQTVIAAVFWADGELELSEILRRVAFEFSADCVPVVARHFAFMHTHGMIRMLQAGEPVPKPEKSVKESGDGMAGGETTA